MTTDQITIKPTTLIVFEGLDATGKTTQLNRLKDAAEGNINGHALFTDPPLFTSQPGGDFALGERIYELTEGADIVSPWARQFLHLAAHSEHYVKEIAPAIVEGRSIFMDRCWWSTIAYGFFGGGLNHNLSFQDFLQVARYPTMGIIPSIVFLFMEPYKDDRHNTPLVREGYKMLQGFFGDTLPVVEVPQGPIDDVTSFIIQELGRYELLITDED